MKLEVPVMDLRSTFCSVFGATNSACASFLVKRRSFSWKIAWRDVEVDLPEELVLN